jgi:hypothetical protein
MMATVIFYKMFLSRNHGSLQCDGIDNENLKMPYEDILMCACVATSNSNNFV